MTKPSILVMAGGTGGHIFPGLAVAEYLRARGWSVAWLGNPNGMEYRLVPGRGFQFESVVFGGLRGKGLLTKLMLPLNLARACWQSWSIIRRLKPSVVLGMGGYITFPGGLMSALLKRPLVLHEANSVAGSANRYLSKIATKTLTGFPNTLPGSEWVGNPIRTEFEVLDTPAQRYGKRAGPLSLLVVGGSLGASALNETIPAALALIPLENRPIVLHQAGEKHVDGVKQRYAEWGVVADVRAFIDDMAGAYASADLVVCRSGAMTVSELAASGVASCLVPFPFAIDDHQTANAQFLANANAAKLLPQTEFNPSAFAQWLQGIGRIELLQMAECAHQLAKMQATERVAAICAECAEVSR